MTATTLFEAAGGLALFLLAMAMMTDGLRQFGGAGLKALLERSTATRLRGMAAGAVVTALVQSSSAVTVATIGFVNAGVLGLPHALGVVLGASLGTTITGWLVSLVGFGFKIQALALPILAVGVALKLVAPGRRLQGLGQALAGFGLFFLGLGFLQSAFAGLSDGLAAQLPPASGWAGVLLFVGIGFAATLLTQSSSAAIALILTAAGHQAIGLDAAAAAVIGANVGTTSTSALAVLKATPNARRVAAGHIVFNAVSACVGLALLPLLLWAVATTGDGLGAGIGTGIGGWATAPTLALFHTAFNLLGAALMLPLVGRLAGRLDRLFRTQEEDLARPRHLDATVAGTPELALAALGEELRRMRRLVLANVASAFAAAPSRAERVDRRAEAVAALGPAITEFATTARMGEMPRDAAEALSELIRVARYLEEASRLTPQIEALEDAAAQPQATAARPAVEAFLTRLREAFSAFSATEADPGAGAAALTAAEADYQATKAALLRLGADRRLSVDRLDGLLDALSRCRRLVDQFAKADRRLRAPDASPQAAAAGDEAAAPI